MRRNYIAPSVELEEIQSVQLMAASLNIMTDNNGQELFADPSSEVLSKEQNVWDANW